MPRAIIVGASGQDGTLLYQLLEEKTYKLFGIRRNKVITNCETWMDNRSVDIGNFQQVSALVQEIQPDEIYHLAAIHQSSEDPIGDAVTLFNQSFEVNVASLYNFLEAVRQFSPQTRLFYAASSHIFGIPEREPQDENTLVNPLAIYGITKASGLYLCRMYRTVHRVYASVGILYNHESWLRGEQFVSQKIVQGAIRCKNDPHHKVILGDLTSEVDWGFAPDYIEAMRTILSLPQADDFIVATGEKHSVEEFASIAFDSLGLDSQDFVEVRKEIIIRPAIALVGNPAKLAKNTGWKRSVTFPEMVRLLVKMAEGFNER